MPDTQQEKPVDLGRFPRPESGGETHPSDIVAAVLCLVWIATVAAYFLLSPDGTGPIGVIMSALVVFLPLALIWVSVSTARSIRALRDEAARLQASVDAMRNAYVAQSQAASVGVKPSVEKKLDEIAAAQRQTELALHSFVSRRDAVLAVPAAERKTAPALARAPASDEQPTLALGTPVEELGPPLTVADFIRALNFPESPMTRRGSGRCGSRWKTATPRAWCGRHRMC